MCLVGSLGSNIRAGGWRESWCWYMLVILRGPLGRCRVAAIISSPGVFWMLTSVCFILLLMARATPRRSSPAGVDITW